MGPGDAGLRLDVFVARHVATLSRTQVRRLIDDGRITVAGRPAKASLPLDAGAEVRVEVPGPVAATPASEAIPLAIVYEDSDIVVVDKPAGMVVHPAAGHAGGTLVNALLHHVRDLSGVGGEQRPGIVHRLDRGTSGLMVVAKHDLAHRSLTQQFHDRQVTKEYTALVWGRLDAGQTMASAIGRDPRQRLKMSSRSARPRSATTTVLDAEPLGDVTLVRVQIGTGRTHQIRVHLRSIGHPVVGDARYGGARQSLPMARPFLHAEVLELVHPVTGEPLSFWSPLPADLTDVLAGLA